MMDYFVFCVVGRTLIYTGQKFPLNHLPIIGKFFDEGKFLRQLFDCDFCLGVWVFTILSAIFRMNILLEWIYVPVISELITGSVTSFLVHLVRLGWQTKFSVIVVE